MSEPNQAVVLLVDADPAVHDLVSRAITTECAFLGARTAELALRLAGKRAPTVVILDDQLPDATPDKLYAEIKALCPGTRAILVTSSRDPDHTAKLASMGPVLTKPLDEERLRVAVRAVLRLHAMSAGVERMKTGEFPALPNLHRSAPTRREGPK